MKTLPFFLSFGFLIFLLGGCQQSSTEKSKSTLERIEPGYKLDENSDDPNERIFIPEKYTPGLIFNTWKITSIQTAENLELSACDYSREITFTNTKKGSQSGIAQLAFVIKQKQDTCKIIDRKTVWYFNPYAEREAVLLNLPLADQYVSGSFKITGLNSESMTLTKDFYQIVFSRVRD